MDDWRLTEMSDWFERLTGFQEEPYEATQRRLHVRGEYLQFDGNPRKYRIGVLELPSLGELRQRVASACTGGELKFSHVQGDVRKLHQAGASSGALFQVASQFNLLEMIGPDVTPEDGVTRYEWDRTQGPACAISAGAATLYRNYLVPINGVPGQTACSQLDTLLDLRAALAAELGVTAEDLWTMKNGYTVTTCQAIQALGDWLTNASEGSKDALRSVIRIGLHWNVEVTDEPEIPGSVVSQAFCSAIPVSYSSIPASAWEPLGRLVLEAAYEATFCAAALNTRDGNTRKLYLTRLGGGAFGNPSEWIDDALRRSLAMLADKNIEAHLVQYGP